MRKIAVFLLLLGLGLTPHIRAQTIPNTANLTASDSGACTTAGACLTVNVPGSAAASVIQLTGTFTGTLQFEGTTSVGGTFVAVSATPLAGGTAVTSATAVGSWRVTASGLAQIRVRCSAFSSGPIVAAITLSTGSSGTGASSSGGAVSSVFGRTGAVVAVASDYTLDLIGNPAATPTTAFGSHLPWSLTATGVFTNTTPGVNGPIVAGNLNSCSPSTEWLVFNRTGTADTEGITGCVTIGAGSTATQATAVAGYANVSSTSTNGVGGYFQGVCTVTGVKCWGVNSLAETLSGHAASFVQSDEVDLNIQNTADQGTALDIAGGWTAQPTVNASASGNMPAIKISKPVAVSGGPYFWTSGVSCDTAATSDGSAANVGACITLNPVLTANGSLAQSIVYHPRTSGGTIKTLYGTAGADTNSKAYAAIIDGATGFGAYQALLPVHSFNYTGLSDANIISAGTCAVSSSTTCSVTFSTPYTLAAPVCTATPTSDPTAVGVYWVTPATTTLTITVKVSGTVTFDYHCIPTAN